VILRNDKVLFNSSDPKDGPTQSTPTAEKDLPAPVTLAWKQWREPITANRVFDPLIDIAAVAGGTPIDQVHVSNDTTDYMWYSTNVSLKTSGAR
jgi:hypothetical protein